MPNHDPCFSDDSDEDFAEWQRNHKADLNRVIKAPNVEVGISKLVQKGADKDKLLSLLVISSPHRDTEPMRKAVKQRIKNLRTLAKKLKGAADELESAFASDSGFAETWKYLLFPLTFQHAPDYTKARSAIRQQSDSIRRLARMLIGEAAILARLAKHYPKLNEKLLLGSVIRYVRESTGQFHERILAEILTAAHNELGADLDYMDETLKKFRQRELPNLIRKRRFLTLDTSGMLTGLFYSSPSGQNKWDKSPSKN